MTNTESRWDIIVIGAGIVGVAIARSLSRYRLRILVVEQYNDIGEGTSKANAAIIHTGFDAPPHSLESRLLARSRPLWQEIFSSYPIPHVPCGAYMLAFDDAEAHALAGYQHTAWANEVPVSLVSSAHVRDQIPAVSSQLQAALAISGESVLDPFSAIRAFGEQAADNGVAFLFDCRVTGIAPENDGLWLDTTQGRHWGAWVVNAGGLWGDRLAQALGDDISLFPRKGQFLIAEEDLGINAILLPVPTPTSKGVLIAPIAFGGLLLGPTAEDTDDKDDFNTTAPGLEHVLQATGRMVPGVSRLRTIRQFAGLRAVSPRSDYVIEWSKHAPRVLHVLGIRSTGVSASPAIAAYVTELLFEKGLEASPKDAWASAPALFSNDDPATDQDIVCLCRTVTGREIQQALSGPLPAHTLDGVKRRSGAALGECQGNLCNLKIMDRIAAVHGVPWTTVQKQHEPLRLVERIVTPPPVPPVAQPVPPTADIVVVGNGRTGGQLLDLLTDQGLAPLGLDPDSPHRLSVAATVIALDVAHDKVTVYAQAPDGLYPVDARVAILASGSYHLPPGSLSLPGSRPPHVYTPDSIQRFRQRGVTVGRLPVFVGLTAQVQDEIIDLALWYRELGAAPTVLLANPGLTTVARATRHQLPYTAIVEVKQVTGRSQFESVTVATVGGQDQTFAGDMLCLSGGHGPMAPYLKHQHAILRDARGFVTIDATGRTSHARVFAAGSVARPYPVVPFAIAQAVSHAIQNEVTP